MKKLLSAFAASLIFATTLVPATASATERKPVETSAPVAYTAETAAISLQERANKTGLNEAEYLKAKRAGKLPVIVTDTAKPAVVRPRPQVKPRPQVRRLRTVPTRAASACNKNEHQHPTVLPGMPREDRD